MIIFYTSDLTFRILRKLCKINNIKRVNKLNKNDLLNLLNCYKFATIIQKKFREKLMIEKFCPISFNRLKYPFISIKIANIYKYYDFETLINYFNKTNNLIDPSTRVELTDKNVLYINNLIRYFYGYNSNKILISKSMIKSTELNIIIHCLFELYKEIKYMENIDLDILYNNILPNLIYYVNFLIKNHDENYIYIILNSFKHDIILLGDKKEYNIIVNYLNIFL